MEEILSRIMDCDKWPTISLPENLELLNEIADHSFAENTFSGMLAATMMYQQIIEAMCCHLIDDCHFQIQLSLYPTSISFKNNSSKMLGFFLEELKTTIAFYKKEMFIERVEKFNAFRNRIVHEMRKSNVEALTRELSSAKNSFDEIFDLYDEIRDNFRVIFHSFAKDEFNDLVNDAADK